MKSVPASLFIAQAYIGKWGLFAWQCFFSAVCYAWRPSRPLGSSATLSAPMSSMWSWPCSGQKTTRRCLFKLNFSSNSRMWWWVKPSLIIAISPWCRRLLSKFSTSSGTLPTMSPIRPWRTDDSGCLLSTTMLTLRLLKSCPWPAICSPPPSCLGCLVFYLLVTSLVVSYKFKTETQIFSPSSSMLTRYSRAVCLLPPP